ncbi:MAG: TlpA disulfide reductase family protein [Anaerolineales bacterium]|jgi:cytochrome c biogenesis protein CcmG/thiol:disulfide interchange protein DsbE
MRNSSSALNSLLMDGRRWTALTLTVLALGLAWTFASRAPVAATTGGAPPPSPREGFSAPDFTLDSLDGGQTTLSDLRGQIVLVNLWASWCLPCRAEMPAIERVYRSYKDLGLEVLAVNATNQDSVDAARAFVQERGLTFPVLLDRTGSVSAAYNLRGLPSSFFIDRQGVIRSVVIGGPMNEALIQSKVESLLKEMP